MHLSTRVHGIMDYGYGVLLIILPWVLGFASHAAAAAVPIAIGAALIVNAGMTHFEMGVFRRIHIPVHLWIDGILGLLLAISPWIGSFDGTVWAPHLVGGLAIMVSAFLTQTVPGYERRGTGAPRSP